MSYPHRFSVGDRVVIRRSCREPENQHTYTLLTVVGVQTSDTEDRIYTVRSPLGVVHQVRANTLQHYSRRTVYRCWSMKKYRKRYI